ELAEGGDENRLLAQDQSPASASAAPRRAAATSRPATSRISQRRGARESVCKVALVRACTSAETAAEVRAVPVETSAAACSVNFKSAAGTSALPKFPASANGKSNSPGAV